MDDVAIVVVVVVVAAVLGCVHKTHMFVREAHIKCVKPALLHQLPVCAVSPSPTLSLSRCLFFSFIPFRLHTKANNS